MRRVLFISYAFPPTGGGGVQRSVKFIKYLPQFGWQPTVLTAANPSVPVRDADLMADVDPAVEIVRARTWEPSYWWKKRFAADSITNRTLDPVEVNPHVEPLPSRSLASLKRWVRGQAMIRLQPDPQVLWNGSAYRRACRVLRRRSHDAIFVTGPPFSSFLLGCRLKNAFSLPLIVDFRDEWTLACRYLDNYQQFGHIADQQHALMDGVLASADAVIATTRASADELKECCDDANSAADVHCIHNGYDPSDLATLRRAKRDPTKHENRRRFRLVYTGTLWRLTDIGPLVAAISRLHQSDPELIGRLELVLAGRRTLSQDAVLSQLEETAATLVRHDYLPHDESLQLAADADALLLLLSGDDGAERVVPAKLFEYLSLQRPVLAICPEGETRDLLWTHGKAVGFSSHDIAGIADWLAKRLKGESGREPGGTRSEFSQFSRPMLTERLANLFSHCLAGRSVTCDVENL